MRLIASTKKLVLKSSRWLILSSIVVFSVGLVEQAQATDEESLTQQTWTVNFKDTDIQELIRFVAKASERTIIVDPKVKGKVQVISANPVNAEELYALFLSILEIHGFAAVDSGDITRIIPSKDARAAPVPVIRDQESLSTSSEIVTQVIQLENISAQKLIPVLRPLVPQQGHMAAYGPSNAIIISDTMANINRIRQVIESIDLSAVEKTEIIPLEYASAEEIVRMLQQLQKTESAKGQADVKKLTLVADKRTNSILVAGDELERQRLESLITHLDTPLAQSGNVKVIYLKYADATELSVVLSKVAQNMERMSENNEKTRLAGKSEATIEADDGTNSLIVTAEADTMQLLLAVVAKLDIRRAQVQVEVIIVEMTDNDGRDLGVEWLFINDSGGYGASNNSGLGSTIAGAAFETNNNGSSVDARGGIAEAIGGAAGQVLGIGRLDDDLSFNVVVNALQQNSEANILSTPSLLTLDNEEASFVVGQSIPFVTGSYTATGSSSSNPDNPFQTVERENVGITLRVTPQINEGDSLILAISQEVSNVIGTSTILNSNPITSERKIETTILADNGQTIVLGGLIEDNITESIQKVPILGDIPFLGRLFRSTSTSVGKKNLLIFLRPTIVRDKRQMDNVTAGKYRLIREQQLREIDEGVNLIDDRTLPLLPEWQEQLEQLQEIQESDVRAGRQSISN
ncbi:general secretion pathway protein D [marine gamma proteobacterium HTCC2143]|jgi:general secretion pathway protein D|uniref:General secretion pathway protein D n=1 Tax=marine gamma proteobacterium HTCC2143 TaxID=247633 RepID=A0YG33_9GAMM|nr:general secretion pathway protein D [marine gamma proteobacterium HTCC2143]